MEMNNNFETKKNEWLEKNCFNADCITYVYFPADSYDVKEELKDAGFRFSKELYWHCAEVPEGYEDKVISVELFEIAMLTAWGEGIYAPEAKSTVERKMKASRPEEKSNSDWIFEVKEKFVDYPVVFKSIREVETKFGWTQLVKFEDENGNVLDWWTKVNIQASLGDPVLLSGTVKDHNEYNGARSTVVTRCKIKAVQ